MTDQREKPATTRTQDAIFLVILFSISAFLIYKNVPFITAS